VITLEGESFLFLERILFFSIGKNSLFLKENLLNPSRKIFSLFGGKCDHFPSRFFILSPKKLLFLWGEFFVIRQGGYLDYLGRIFFSPKT